MANTAEYLDLREKIESKGAKLIAVSKTKSAAAILELYALGQRDFGENYVQELVEKQAQLPKDIRWHFIGSLQRNKVRYIAPFVHCIHSVVSPQLAVEINKQATANNRLIDCLLQVHVAQEETKSGFEPRELIVWLEQNNWLELSNIRWCGIMGMASFTDDKQQVTKEFKLIKSTFETLKTSVFADESSFQQISMGMSGDYHEALACGSTMVRIGSLLFGSRN